MIREPGNGDGEGHADAVNRPRGSADTDETLFFAEVNID